ncbi:MAG TPA: glycosyltransferase, partial [Puia sp.]|nr:glycosyltransferase [Puia sp.]
KGRRKTILSVRTLLSKEIANTPKMKAFGRFIHRLYNKSDQIIVPSKLVALDLVNNYGIKEEKLKVIYNFIDQEKITTMAVESMDNDFYSRLFQLPILLNVGRITPAKGQWLLFEVLKKMKNQFPDWRLVIIGESDTEGNLKTDLIRLSRELGLTVYDSIEKKPFTLDYDIYLLGFQMNPFKYMKRSKLLVFPSVFEGFPNTVLEAMQSGLPVIVADCPSGPREILAHDTDLEFRTHKIEITEYGILAPCLPVADIHQPIDRDIIEQWVNGTTALIHDGDLQSKFVENGYLRVKDFDKDSILLQWEKSIDSQ